MRTTRDLDGLWWISEDWGDQEVLGWTRRDQGGYERTSKDLDRPGGTEMDPKRPCDMWEIILYNWLLMKSVQ